MIHSHIVTFNIFYFFYCFGISPESNEVLRKHIFIPNPIINTPKVTAYSKPKSYYLLLTSRIKTIMRHILVFPKIRFTNSTNPDFLNSQNRRCQSFLFFSITLIITNKPVIIESSIAPPIARSFQHRKNRPTLQLP